MAETYPRLVVPSGRRIFVALMTTAAIRLAAAGWPAQHHARTTTQRGWAGVPVAGRAAVARALASSDPKYFARRSAAGFLLTGSGRRASPSRQGAVYILVKPSTGWSDEHEAAKLTG